MKDQDDHQLCPHCEGDISGVIAAVIAERKRRMNTAAAKSRWSKMTPEQRSEANQGANYTSEARVRAARKSWETRRANAAATKPITRPCPTCLGIHDPPCDPACEA